MMKPVKCCSRNVQLGSFVAAVVIVSLWQLAKLSHQNVSADNYVIIKSETTVQPADKVKPADVPFNSKCICNNKTSIKAATTNPSSPGEFHWCSADSSARGAHQKVITYSLFGTGKNENVTVSNRFDSLLKNISITARKSIPAGSSASITISTIKVNRKMSFTKNCAICITSLITLTFAVSQTWQRISHRWRPSILLFYEDSTEECSAFWWCSIPMWTFSYRGTLTVLFARGKLTLLING